MAGARRAPACGAGDRRARARARRAVRARRGRIRSSHVPLRAVGLGQDVLARRDPRAAADRDGPPDHRARSQLGLHPAVGHARGRRRRNGGALRRRRARRRGALRQYRRRATAAAPARGAHADRAGRAPAPRPDRRPRRARGARSRCSPRKRRRPSRRCWRHRVRMRSGWGCACATSASINWGSGRPASRARCST